MSVLLMALGALILTATGARVRRIRFLREPHAYPSLAIREKNAVSPGFLGWSDEV